MQKLAKILGLVLGIFLSTSLLFAAPQSGSNRDINIYCEVTPQVTDSIRSFNSYLDNQGLIKKYQLSPFILNHPVHLTLYLTTYNTKNLPKIISKIKALSKTMKPFSLQTTKIESSASNFVLLDVNVDKNRDGSENLLQRYSNKIVNSVGQYRDKSAEIPAWANNIPLKKAMYQKYGSPNVFSQFNAHFSILAADIAPAMETQYLADMQKAVDNYKFQPVTATVNKIGIGYVDKNGQVTQKIVEYSLK